MVSPGNQLRIALMIGIAASMPFAAAGFEDPAVSVLRNFPSSSDWKFECYRGKGKLDVQQSPKGLVVEMRSEGDQGMAAALHSQRIPVEPNRQYTIRIDVKTQGLEAIDADLTAAPYVQFWDAQSIPGGYQPVGSVAESAESAFRANIASSSGRRTPRDSDWHTVSATVISPSTARSAELFLAYAANGPYADDLRPQVSGRARGRVLIRNPRWEAGVRISPLPATIKVSDPVIQSAINAVANGFHNGSLSGTFVDSDGYTDSSNIVPDLSFGLYGVRRQGQRKYMEIFAKEWETLGLSATPEGKLSQRVMCQILFPLGVDEIFSFTGDERFLARMLPIANRILDYVNQRADENGLVRLVDYGKWRIGQGADWDDWYPTRMEGKTFNFHQWYVRALRRTAALNEEFAAKHCPFASLERARLYRSHADLIQKSLGRLYWASDHFVTNIDFGDKIADQKWLDDQLWAIYFGIASPDEARSIWSWIDKDSSRLEGVPTAWCASSGPELGPLTWFGRIGAGDILARYHTGNPGRGLELLKRISEIFARDQNVYEAYTMSGKIAPGTLGWGNYTEHCGGYIWALVEGPLGLSFERDREALATLRPQRFPHEWSSAQAQFWVRGTRILLDYNRSGDRLTVRITGEEGAERPIRVVSENGKPQIWLIGAGVTKSLVF
ncbi:MAG TPA: hypothetical protein VEO19_01650 [Terriglobia bacterium]|nr:hypothetical protein [Terriglobia bacterium]